jgi:iron complex outermembrane recepter protein
MFEDIPMKPCLLSGLALAALLTPAEVLAQDSRTDVIIITGAPDMTQTDARIAPETLPVEGVDVTAIIARTPGAARIANGALSGQMQYRGLFGERLNLRVNGQKFASGGPNLMDPVFHYAPSVLTRAIRIDRGVSPVSEGPGLGGGADAQLKRVNYGTGEAFGLAHDVTLQARSIDDSVALGGVVGVSNEDWRFHVIGASEEGSDTEFPGGVIAGSAFERDVYGFAIGHRNDLGEISLDVRRQNTGPSGNPPFPMDIRFFDGDFVSLGYEGEWGGIGVRSALFASDIAHGMNNFSLRPAPMDMQQRETFADASTRGATFAAVVPSFGGELTLGLDVVGNTHNVTITNPNHAGFMLRAIPDAAMDRAGGFAQWGGRARGFDIEAGLRLDRHGFEAGPAATGPAVPAGPAMLAASFSAGQRAGEEITTDLALRIARPAANGLVWRGVLARKQAMPSYLQRFGWLPTNASGGLADGNIYVGDFNLKPETALIAEIGFDYRANKAYLRPTLFIREIDDFIQGIAFDSTPGVINSPVEMIAAMNGDATPLRFANVDARLTGFDVDAGYDFAGPWRVDAVISHVEGERRDIDDALYRMAPLRIAAGLTFEQLHWSATLEAVSISAQDRVSVTNSEVASEAYMVVNLFGRWQINERIEMMFGIENVADTEYRDHLSGYNRNGAGDAGLGERLPGAGRGAFARIRLKG